MDQAEILKRQELSWKNLMNTFSEDAVLLDGMSFMFNSIKYSLPIILIHDTGIYAFCDLNSVEENFIQDHLTRLHKSLSGSSLIAPSGILVYGIKGLGEGKSNVFMYDSYFDLTSLESNDLIDMVYEELKQREIRFSEDDIYQIYNLLKMKGCKEEDVYESEEYDEERYIKRRGTLYEASDLNSEINFYLTVFCGFLGLHKFYQRKWIKGIIYLITFGFCGIGWFFDIVEVLFGITKDSFGYYLKPVKRKVLKVIISVIALLEIYILCRLYFHFITVIVPSFISMFDDKAMFVIENIFG